MRRGGIRGAPGGSRRFWKLPPSSSQHLLPSRAITGHNKPPRAVTRPVFCRVRGFRGFRGSVRGFPLTAKPLKLTQNDIGTHIPTFSGPVMSWDHSRVASTQLRVPGRATDGRTRKNHDFLGFLVLGQKLSGDGNKTELKNREYRKTYSWIIFLFD